MYDNIWMDHSPRPVPYWLPNRELGSNIDAATVPLSYGAEIPGCPRSVKGIHNGHKYYFNGTNVIPYHATVTADSTLYRIASVYHDRSAIYHVNYDASANAIGEANHSNNHEVFMDWQEIQFRHGPDRSSRIDTNAGGSLRMTRANSIWPGNLIPPRYHPEVDRNVPNMAPPSGCLGGNIALLIALVALSASPEHQDAVHHTLLGSLIASDWQVAHQNDNPGCKFRHGRR
jgi:hypothetical protein